MTVFLCLHCGILHLNQLTVFISLKAFSEVAASSLCWGRRAGGGHVFWGDDGGRWWDFFGWMLSRCSLLFLLFTVLPTLLTFSS